jgi:hypothetical protein
MMNSPRKILAAAALLAATSPAAHALDLYTSFSQAQIGSKIACGIVNTGTKPIEVAATVQDYFVGSDITGATTCPLSPATLPAGTGCVASTNAAGNVGYCHFTTASSKVHAALLVVNSSGDVTSTLEAAK